MAKELELKYGCNPNQKPARIYMQEGELPIEVLNGRPGYITWSITLMFIVSAALHSLQRAVSIHLCQAFSFHLHSSGTG